jgi:hypothetical protein
MDSKRRYRYQVMTPLLARYIRSGNLGAAKGFVAESHMNLCGSNIDLPGLVVEVKGTAIPGQVILDNVFFQPTRYLRCTQRVSRESLLKLPLIRSPRRDGWSASNSLVGKVTPVTLWLA